MNLGAAKARKAGSPGRFWQFCRGRKTRRGRRNLVSLPSVASIRLDPLFYRPLVFWVR